MMDLLTFVVWKDREGQHIRITSPKGLLITRQKHLRKVVGLKWHT
jgi:hypothetical protein